METTRSAKLEEGAMPVDQGALPTTPAAANAVLSGSGCSELGSRGIGW